MSDPKTTIIRLLMQLETPNHRLDHHALLNAFSAWEAKLAAGVALPLVHRLSDKEIEKIAGTDELTGDAILGFAHRLLNVTVGVKENKNG